MTKTIAVLGGRGMLGSDLVRFLAKKFPLEAIDLDNYENCCGQEFDVLVNANGNSRRFWANTHPLEDFEASTVSVYRSVLDFKFKKYVYISSSDVYPEHGKPATTKETQVIDYSKLPPYGLHKYLSEELVRNRGRDFLILRLALILGRSLKKGPIYDILVGQPLFITKDSRLQIITTRAIAEIIEKLVAENISNEVFNLGGRGTFSFKKAEEVFQKTIAVSPEAQLQEYEMEVTKLGKIYALKTSEDYLKEFLDSYGKGF